MCKTAFALTELNFVAFETTVLFRCTVVCVLCARNGHFNRFLPFRALKTHTTVHSVSDLANYLFVGLQGTSSTKPYTESIWWRHKRRLNVIALPVFPPVYFDYDHLHLKLILLKHLGQGKLLQSCMRLKTL